MRDGWREVAVGDIVLVNPREPALPEDAPFVPMEAIEPGKRWVVGTQLRGTRGGARFRGGDVLFARITPCLENGKVAQYPIEMGAAGGSTELIVLRPTSQVDASFLYFWATSPRTRYHAAQLMVGSTGRQRLSPDDLSGMVLALPTLEEQYRIADVCRRLDELISALTTVIDSGSGWFRRSVDAELNADTELLALGDILVSIENGVSPRCLDRQPEGSEYGVLKVSAVLPMRFEPLAVKTLPSDIPADERKVVQHGDILITRASGTISRVGVCCYVRAEPETRLLLSDLIFRVGVQESFDPAFVALALGTKEVRAQVEQRAVGSSTMKKVNKGIVKALPIRVPSPERRESLVRRYDAFVAWRESKEAELSRLEAVRAAVIYSLLSGEHEIPASYDDLLSVNGSVAALDPAAV